MRHKILLALSTLALAGAAPTEARQRGAICNISAYSMTPNLSVRAGPSANARLLRVRDQGSPRAQITGQSGGWFRVSTVIDEEDGTVLFRGDGWVRVPALGLSIANDDPWVYARASRRSGRVARLVPDGSQVTLLGCAGDWARISFRRRVGWLSRGGQCANPLTTCP